MEFSGLLSLPEEKIEEICYQMDDVTLARFLKVSQDTRRICSKVLENKDKVYRDKITELINREQESTELKSLDPNRSFELVKGKIVYYIIEKIYKPVFALEKYNDIVPTYTHVFEDVNDLIEVLLDLIHRGYITI